MKLGIVGCGFVGSAVKNAFESKCDITVVDPVVNSNTIEYMTSIEDLDVVFVCVPTPQSEDGSCDTSIVEKVVAEIADTAPRRKIIVIKSTVPPDCLADLTLRHPEQKIVFNPEFLTQVNANDDFIKPDVQIYGGPELYCKTIESIYKTFSDVHHCPHIVVDIETASLIKYALNTFMATKVAYMNFLYEVVEKSGSELDYSQFSDILGLDKRVGRTHLSVPGPDGKFGFGGACFPKDTAAFSAYCEDLGVDADVLNAAISTNKKHRNK